MKASNTRLLEYLNPTAQFIIPIYQRAYSWTAEECEQLWTDIMRAGSDDGKVEHFLGSIVYIEDTNAIHGFSRPLIIDGQQRLTSSTLLITALEKKLDSFTDPSDRSPVEGFSPKAIRMQYLTNPAQEGDKEIKLVLSKGDKEVMFGVIAGHNLPADGESRVADNYRWFAAKLNEPATDLAAVCRGLAKLTVVNVKLERGVDDPQLVFESMNSTGKKLSQSDLIRNFMLMDAEHKLQAELYEGHWFPMEQLFGSETSRDRQFDGFVRHFLTMKSKAGDIPRIDDVYEAFRSYAGTSEVREAGKPALAAELHRFAGYFSKMALGTEPSPPLASAFNDLRELKGEVVYPMLLRLYERYDEGSLALDDFLAVLRLVESYIFRRAALGLASNSHGRTFSTMYRALVVEDLVSSVEAYFVTRDETRRFPKDEEFRDALQTRDSYHTPRRSYLLRKLENFGHKEPIVIENYTIEHIMPQNPEVPPAWREALGDDWRLVHDKWLHTLGNLTLTGYNSEYSDHPFEKKRDMDGGFSQSHLHLNSGLGQVGTWNEDEIVKRAQALSLRSAEIWQRPTVSVEARQAFLPQATVKATYSRGDHPNLDVSPNKALFDALVVEIRALDSAIQPEYLKLYVAFKAVSNFVDVIAQKSQLKLSLSIPFEELHDPNGIAVDVSAKGHWANGDVEFPLWKVGQLPYAMGLVRQAYDRQMG